MKRPFSLLLSFLGALAVVFAGCAGSPSARFYTLTPLDHQQAPSSLRTSTFSVRVMPAEVPDYLDRPQIMTREGKNGWKLAEFDRWAGSLSENISSVLVENLGLLLASDRVFFHPGMGGERAEYSVALQVLRLDCQPGDQVLLKARWTITHGQESGGKVTKVTTFSKKLSDGRYETLVAGISQTVELVSREIAHRIISLSRGAKSDQQGEARFIEERQ